MSSTPELSPPWISPLRPDLLTEQLLTTCPDLAELVLTGYDRLTADDQAPGGAQVAQLLTELTRAATATPSPSGAGPAARRPATRPAHHRNRRSGRPAARPAQPRPRPLSSTAVRRRPGSPVARAQHRTGCARRHPHRPGRRRLPRPRRHRPRHAHPRPRQVAEQPVHPAGRPRAAPRTPWPRSTRPSTIHRALAAARPDAFTPDLAALAEQPVQPAGRPRAAREDALAAIDEAVTTYRALAAARPDAFTPDLARSLNNLSNRLADLGRARGRPGRHRGGRHPLPRGWPPPTPTPTPPTSPAR